jgi:hypothetical protein
MPSLAKHSWKRIAILRSGLDVFDNKRTSLMLKVVLIQFAILKIINLELIFGWRSVSQKKELTSLRQKAKDK